MNLYSRVYRGYVDQCSFGFDIIKEEYSELRDGSADWTLKEIKLYEVSVVTFPAYEETTVSAGKKGLLDIQKRNIEMFKRKALKKLRGEK